MKDSETQDDIGDADDPELDEPLLEDSEIVEEYEKSTDSAWDGYEQETEEDHEDDED